MALNQTCIKALTLMAQGHSLKMDYVNRVACVGNMSIDLRTFANVLKFGGYIELIKSDPINGDHEWAISPKGQKELKGN